MSHTLEQLINIAKTYQYDVNALPIDFSCEPYTRTPIFKDDNLEIVAICFRQGQTSSVHDHQGSNCVVNVVRGELLETLFDTEDNGKYSLRGCHSVNQGGISGLDGVQVHQLSAMTETVLLNFYSPPFKV